jgi:hypothetical protein
MTHDFFLCLKKDCVAGSLWLILTNFVQKLWGLLPLESVNRIQFNQKESFNCLEMNTLQRVYT